MVDCLGNVQRLNCDGHFFVLMSFWKCYLDSSFGKGCITFMGLCILLRVGLICTTVFDSSLDRLMYL